MKKNVVPSMRIPGTAMDYSSTTESSNASEPSGVIFAHSDTSELVEHQSETCSPCDVPSKNQPIIEANERRIPEEPSSAIAEEEKQVVDAVALDVSDLSISAAAPLAHSSAKKAHEGKDICRASAKASIVHSLRNDTSAMTISNAGNSSKGELDQSSISTQAPLVHSSTKIGPTKKDNRHASAKTSIMDSLRNNTSAITNSDAGNSSKMKSVHFILPDLLNSDKDLNIWTGVPSLDLLQEICLACRKLEQTLYPRQFNMHTTDRVILTLAKFKQNLSYEALGILFHISGVTVSCYISHMIQILRRVLTPFVYWPSKEEISSNIPQCFRQHFPNVTLVLDCTEIPVATPKCLNCRISCYSNYKGRRTVKFLIGVTPAGLISFISNAYTGKSSDKYIFNEEKIIQRLEAHRDEVMVDKGVSIQHECLEHHIKLHIPPFMKNERLNAAEASRNEAIAKARIHVERVIQRVKLFNILTDYITPTNLGHIDLCNC